jgi:hypothetical protein
MSFVKKAFIIFSISFSITAFAQSSKFGAAADNLCKDIKCAQKGASDAAAEAAKAAHAAELAKHKADSENAQNLILNIDQEIVKFCKASPKDQQAEVLVRYTAFGDAVYGPAWKKSMNDWSSQLHGNIKTLRDLSSSASVEESYLKLSDSDLASLSVIEKQADDILNNRNNEGYFKGLCKGAITRVEGAQPVLVEDDAAAQGNHG